MPDPTALNTILPPAISWAEASERDILSQGVPLNPRQIEDAKTIGVARPEKVRLLRVAGISEPSHPLLREINRKVGLITPGTGGLTLRYGVYVRSDCWDRRQLIAHELVHVMQYERFGGVREFLAKYIGEVLSVGYQNSAMKREAVRIAESYL